MRVRIITGDCRAILPTLAAESFDCCVTSPPYFGLRDYGVEGQIGLEATLASYIAEMVGVCREIRRALKPEGTFWLNVGDSYANDGKWGGSSGGKHVHELHGATGVGRSKRNTGLKPKDLMLAPYRLAIALQEDGWFVRSNIVWSKPNPMPESVTDRPTCAHETVWLLTKSARYFYEADAIREPLAASSVARLRQDIESQAGSTRANGGAKTNGAMKAVVFGGSKGQGNFESAGRRASGREWQDKSVGANARNVWTIASHAYSGAHFATMPPALAERCILAGCPMGGHVLDPFGGAGTTGLVADRIGRDATLIDLNPGYVDLQRQRISDDAGLFAEVS